MFELQLDVLVYARPADEVKQSLSHFNDTGVAFVCELKKCCPLLKRIIV